MRLSYVNLAEYSKPNLPVQREAACGPGLLATVDSILKALLLHAIRAAALRIFKSQFL